jgi:hypothetical protein
MNEYLFRGDNPRQYGIGKLPLVMSVLTASGDIRSRIHACTSDFIIATMSLVDHIPMRIAERMIAVAVELRHLQPDAGFQSILGGVGHTPKGVKIADQLAAAILSVYQEIMEFHTADCVWNDQCDVVTSTGSNSPNSTVRPPSYVLSQLLPSAADPRVSTLAERPAWDHLLPRIHAALTG